MKTLCSLLMLGAAALAVTCFLRSSILGAWLLIGLLFAVYVFWCTAEDGGEA